MAEAPELEALYQEYADDGFIVITLIGETSSGGPPGQADLQTWADRFGLTHPVVADPSFQVGGSYVPGNSIGLPSLSLLGPGAEIITADRRPQQSQIVQALP